MRGIYLIGNYPDKKTFLAGARAVADAGFDFIEVGIPFNDPVADGPVISRAGYEAILHGVRAEAIIDTVPEIKQMGLHVYIMTYANIIHAYGIERFSDTLQGDLSGVIIPDLPNRMRYIFEEKGLAIPIVPFTTLETRETDLEAIAASPAEFIYFIGVRGITGSASNLSSPEINAKIEMIQSHTRKKIVIGFGIKTRGDADSALSVGDGFVVGTEAVRRQHDPAALREYLYSLTGRDAG